MRLHHSLKSAPSPSRDPDPSPGPPVAAAVGHTCRGAGRTPRGAGPSLAACSRVGPGPGQLHSSPESSPHFLLCLEFWLFLNKQKPGRGAPGDPAGFTGAGFPGWPVASGSFQVSVEGNQDTGQRWPRHGRTPALTALTPSQPSLAAVPGRSPEPGAPTFLKGGPAAPTVSSTAATCGCGVPALWPVPLRN